MTIKFPDLSHYVSGIDVSQPDVVAVCTKATQGTGNVDPSYAGYRNSAIAAGKPFSPYHWFDPGNTAAQAKHAVDIAGKLHMMIDDEDTRKITSNGKSRWISPRDTADLIQGIRQNGGDVWGWYYPEWIWGQRGKPDMSPVMELGVCLVSSHYVAVYTDNGPGWASYGGYTPKIWQYTDKQALQGKHADFNAFKGTVEELRALWTGETDMPLTGADAQTVWDRDTIPNPSFRPDSPLHVPPPAPGTENPATQADFALGDIWQRVGDMQDQLSRVAMPSAAEIAGEIIKQLKG